MIATVSIEAVGPDEAARYLGMIEPTDRQTFSASAVNQFVRSMTNGAWLPEKDRSPIAFSDRGFLLDGRHRLKAVVVSGKRQLFFIVRGLDAAGFKTYFGYFGKAPVASLNTGQMEGVLKSGAELMKEGMERAVAHAEREEPGWSDRALATLTDYARSHQFFATEGVVSYAKVRGLPPAPDARAWGGVVTRAKRRGIVIEDGYMASANPQAHLRPTRVWRSLVWQG